MITEGVSNILTDVRDLVARATTIEAVEQAMAILRRRLAVLETLRLELLPAQIEPNPQEETHNRRAEAARKGWAKRKAAKT